MKKELNMQKLSKANKFLLIPFVILAILLFCLNVGVLLTTKQTINFGVTGAYWAITALFIITVGLIIVFKFITKSFKLKDPFFYLAMITAVLNLFVSTPCVGYITNHAADLALPTISGSLSAAYWISLVGNGTTLLFAILYLFSETGVFANKANINKIGEELNQASFELVEEVQ